MPSDTEVTTAEPKVKGNPRNIGDSGGRYLYLTAKDEKSWRYDYRLAGKRETPVIGRYPDFGL